MSGRKTKVEELGAGPFVHELSAKGWSLMEIARAVQDRYRRPISAPAISRYLKAWPTPPPPPSQVADMVRAREAMSHLQKAGAVDGAYWETVLQETAQGLLCLLNDGGADAKARAQAGDTLVKAVTVGTNLAEDRATGEAYRAVSAPSESADGNV